MSPLRPQDIASGLGPDTLPAGTQGELFVSGELVSGASFESQADCVLLVPLGEGQSDQ